VAFRPQPTSGMYAARDEPSNRRNLVLKDLSVAPTGTRVVAQYCSAPGLHRPRRGLVADNTRPMGSHFLRLVEFRKQAGVEHA